MRHWVVEMFVFLIILVSLLLSGFIAGFALSADWQREKQRTLPVFERPKRYQVEDTMITLKPLVAALRLIKNAISGNTNTPEVLPTLVRTKGRVAYDLTSTALTEEGWTLKGNDAEVLRAIAAQGPVSASTIETLTGLKKKSVESSLHRLRHKGLVVSERMNT
jgi:hypothetical protein